MPHRFSAAALFIASSAFMASNALLGRAAIEVMPPVALAFWRWLLAFAIVLPFALPGLLAHRRAIVAAWPRLLLLGGLAMGICGANVYIGLRQTTATNTGLIYAISPVLILLLSAAMGAERIALRQAAGVALAFAGVTVILAQGELRHLLGLDFNPGDLWILSGAVAWAVFTLLLRYWRLGLPTLTLFAANAAAGVIVLAPFYAWESLVWSEPAVFTGRAALLSLGLALFASVFSFTSYQWTIRAIGPSRAGAALYVMPLWTAGLAALWLGEELRQHHLLGAALILPGVVMATLPTAAPDRKTTGP